MKKNQFLTMFTVLLLCSFSICLLSCKKEEKCYYMIQGRELSFKDIEELSDSAESYGDIEEVLTPLWWQSDIDVGKITSISFLKNYAETGKELEKWQVGKTENDKIFCYVIPDREFYSVIIATNDSAVIKNANCSFLFSFFWSLKKVNFENFNTSETTSMIGMFYGCVSLTVLDVSSFDTSNVTDMSVMFGGCTSLTTLDLSGFDTANVTDMSGMFTECTSLTTLDLSGFDTANVTDMRGMFTECTNLTVLDVSGFNTSNVTNMWSMFESCESLTALDLSGFDTANVTDMSYMFHICESLTALDVSNFDTSNVTNMCEMFGGCKSLITLDVSNFDTSNVTDMSDIFHICESLTALDVSGFVTSNVTNMHFMFCYCESLTTLDVSNFDTSNVTNMDSMFGGCKNLTTLDVSNFNTSNVTNMWGMFSGCTNLTTLDLSNFDTSNVKDMSDMFYGCKKLNVDVLTAFLGLNKYVGTYSFTRDSVAFALAGLSSEKIVNLMTTKPDEVKKIFNDLDASTLSDINQILQEKKAKITISRDVNNAGYYTVFFDVFGQTEKMDNVFISSSIYFPEAGMNMITIPVSGSPIDNDIHLSKDGKWLVFNGLFLEKI